MAAATVLLGLRDAAVTSGSSSQGGPAANRLGGVANCIPSVTLVHPTCGLCGAALVHVLQIYCPLDGSPFHRLINVFACVTKSCWGNSDSWKVLRSQYLQEEGKKTQDCILIQNEERPLAAKDWCEGADDWEDEEEATSSQSIASSHALTREMDCAAQIQQLSLGEAPEGSHPSHSGGSAGEQRGGPSRVPVFKPYHISVVEEEDCRSFSDTEHVKKLLQEYQRREGMDLEQLLSGSYTSDGCAEEYEKCGAGRRDRVFHKFMKRISVCQEQILRYSWGGQPLFITCPSTDITATVPPCHNCRGKRIFEFQLMPALVSTLETKEKEVSVEFGTALVYTCEKSCWPKNQPTPLEEFIFVQEDPDQQLFK